MFKKTMTFDDLNENEVTQTFYFNYNKKEVAELLEFKQLEEKLKLLTTPVEESGLGQQENNQQAYDIFQDLILDAYGEKGADNVTFIKNERTREYLKNHVAFVELIFEFLEKPALAAEFIEKCLPSKLVASAKQEMQAKAKGTLTEGTLAEMVEEAEQRQKDPATRIEPGPEAAAEALGPNDEVANLAQSVSENNVTELRLETIDGLSDEEILKKKPVELTQAQLLRAYELKNKG